MKTNLIQTNKNNGNVGTLGTAATGSNKINMKTHITNIEGSGTALRSRKESLKDIFPLVEAMESEDRVITDPETAATNIERGEVEVVSSNQKF